MRVERCERWMVWRCWWLSVIGLVRQMIELEFWRCLIGMDEMGHFGAAVGFADFLWRVVVYPCNKDLEKHLMKV